MPRMVRITAANASTFYGYVPMRSYASQWAVQLLHAFFVLGMNTNRTLAFFSAHNPGGK